MLDWIKKDGGNPDHPMRNPAEAAKLLAELRGADPVTALADLSAWLEAAKGISADDEKLRSEILSLVQEASEAHISALFAQLLARPAAGKQAAHESTWNTLQHFLRDMAGALCGSARHLIRQAAADPSLQAAAAAGAARGLHACQLLAKLYLVHYLSVAPKLWQLAYAVHGDAEKANCAATPVRMYATQKAATTVTQELLRLLMLQTCAPEMLAPEQLEVADRVIEQVAENFTLRPRGATDNVFCFDPASEKPPHRAAGKPPPPEAGIRYFGAGMGLDALERLYRELATTKPADFKAFGKDIAAHVQLSTIRHLRAFWGDANPYSPPAHSPATGTLRITHGYGQIWQNVLTAGSAKTELTLAEDGDDPTQEPETWALCDTGGNELGVEIAQQSAEWARSGDLVGVTMNGDGKCWVGVIRSMHAEPGRGARANIAILSREPRSVQLRPVIAKGEIAALTEDAARQFNVPSVRAIILSDGAAGAQKANFLLAPENWEEGRVYEGIVGETMRQLHGLQLLRRGGDYVRATFDWVKQA